MEDPRASDDLVVGESAGDTEIHRSLALDCAREIDLLIADPGIHPQRIGDLPFIGDVCGDALRLDGRVIVQRAVAKDAVVGHLAHHRACPGHRQHVQPTRLIAELKVRGRHESIVFVGEVRDVGAQCEIVDGAAQIERLGDPQIIGELAQRHGDAQQVAADDEAVAVGAIEVEGLTGGGIDHPQVRAGVGCLRGRAQGRQPCARSLDIAGREQTVAYDLRVAQASGVAQTPAIAQAEVDFGRELGEFHIGAAAQIEI